METTHPLLSIDNLKITYRRRRGFPGFRASAIHAVQGVSFTIKKGETFAIVGETGSGKTSLAMSILKFIKPSNGRILFDNCDIWALKGQNLNRMRRRIQPVFQDPNSALSPRKRVGHAIADGFSFQPKNDPVTRKRKTLRLLSTVGLNDEHFDRFPNQLSGGQKQRICIARALAAEPELIILDEPVAIQDLSIQAHLFNLLANVKQEKGLTYLLISHDLRLVQFLADRIAVMKQGEIVEMAETKTLFNCPTHPYTKTLLESANVYQNGL